MLEVLFPTCFPVLNLKLEDPPSFSSRESGGGFQRDPAFNNKFQLTWDLRQDKVVSILETYIPHQLWRKGYKAKKK